MKPKSIILLSGGLDSTVSAAIAAKKTKPLFALTIDYGQRSAKMEILASKIICQALKIKHRIIKLPFFKEFKKCSLISKDQLPIALKDIWVPNRNALFINIAACFAEYYKADLIVTGFNLEEAREFPDNTKNFINAINQTLQYSTLKKLKVVSYVANYTKKEIYELGLKYKAPLQYIYSCYLGGKKMCGKCPSCLKLLQAKK
ncbi:MAG: 7-cyano-7-deazaguanine synthase QueC [candidate division WOR-3 bacterium]|nr:7-cyano-7-deazaguanine synthase QueC [candidate division WOR-3 bacterium]